MGLLSRTIRFGQYKQEDGYAWGCLSNDVHYYLLGKHSNLTLIILIGE